MCRQNHRLFDDHVFDHHPLFGGSFDGLTRHHQHERFDDDDKFQVTIDVPGVDEKNIEIELKEEQQGQTMLTVRGRRMASTSESSSQVTSKFSKTFSLDDTVDVDKLTAALKNGVLTVSAPKDPQKRETNIRRIPVQVVEAADDGENASAGGADGVDSENASAGGGDEGDDDALMEHAEKDKAEEIIVVDVDKEEADKDEEEGWKTVSKK